LPTALPFSYRENVGATYFWKNYGDYQGWETRHGVERTFGWLYHTGHTDYKAGEFTQTVGYRKIGVIPSFLGVEVTNDLWGDGGDRFRTAHQKINFLGLSIGNIVFTGDPEVYNGKDRTFDNNGRETYNKGPYGANKYSAGIFYVGFGALRVGWDSEGLRHFFQNKIGHDIISPSSPHIYRTNRKPRFFWQLGGGLW
jgi:hypothetical protein